MLETSGAVNPTTVTVTIQKKTFLFPAVSDATSTNIKLSDDSLFVLFLKTFSVSHRQ
jgi:hypothetical protein